MKKFLTKIRNFTDRCFTGTVIIAIISFFIIIFFPDNVDATPLIIICLICLFSPLITFVTHHIINSMLDDDTEKDKVNNNSGEEKNKEIKPEQQLKNDIGAAVGIKCKVCESDNWNATDNSDAIYLYCSNCHDYHSRICFIKQDFIDKFICEDCGCPRGKMIEDDDAITIICDNCFKKNIVFNKPPITINNRNGGGIILSNNHNANQEKAVKCPKCGSTQITAGARGVNFTTGFIGASKTVNRCMKCGHSWTPHK